MESFAIPVRNEKSVKIDERFLSSDGGNILKGTYFRTDAIRLEKKIRS